MRAHDTLPVSAWTPDHLRQIDEHGLPTPPVFMRADIQPVLPGYDVWDMWPLALRDGTAAPIGGGVLWFALSAPVQPDPIERHGIARIRLLHQRGGQWHDCGNALPDGAAPGSREWSGSAVLTDPGAGTLILFFTAAGRAGEPALSFEQRLCQIAGTLQPGPSPRIGWSGPASVSVRSDGHLYHPADQLTGVPGRIKAFRDPAYFHDPFDDHSYLLFAASLGQATHTADGAIGLARADDTTLQQWSLLPPIVQAERVNNELERPHVVHRDGRYYLFWSTQRHTFAADGPSGPTGLYGMVAPRLAGPYQPLNGSGLVIANPPGEPLQAYSWWVMPDGLVTSFVDYWGMQGRSLPEHPELTRTQFGGVPARFERLAFRADRVALVSR